MIAAPPSAGLLVLIDLKNTVVGGIEDFAEQEDLVGVEVPLAHFDLGHGAPGYIAALELEFRRQGVLGHAPGLPDISDILADLVLDFLIHSITILHLYRNNILDIIVMECYDGTAPI